MTPRAIRTARMPNGEWYAAEVEWDLGRPQGWGKTELAAIQDLEDQFEETDEELRYMTETEEN